MRPDQQKFNSRPRINTAAPHKPTPLVDVKQEPSIYDVRISKNKFLNRRSVILGSVVIFVVLIIVTVIFINQIGKHHQIATHSTADSTCPSQPSYQTLTPDGKSIDKFGGWKPGCPPDSEPTYSFVDKTGGTSIIVTEQKLPKNLQSNPSEQIKDIAQKGNMKNKLPTENLTAYIGTNADGPQSIIATDGNLLILVKSKSTISNDDWTNYLQSLESVD